MRHGSAGAGESTDVLYSCACGSECKCGSVDTKPGNCKCGKPMEWGHGVRIGGDTVFACTCAEGCNCSADPKDPMKCGCGKDLKQVSLKDSDIWCSSSSPGWATARKCTRTSETWRFEAARAAGPIKTRRSTAAPRPGYSSPASTSSNRAPLR